MAEVLRQPPLFPTSIAMMDADESTEAPSLPAMQEHDPPAAAAPTVTEIQEFEAAPPELPPPPASPRQSRTKELLARYPTLSVPEAMRAARYTIEQSESLILQSPFEQYTASLRAKKEKRSRRPPGSQTPHPTKRSAPVANDAIDLSSLPEGIVLCEVRPKNQAGRCLCRVEDCRKLDQANNDGFCRAHYNLIVGSKLLHDQDGNLITAENAGNGNVVQGEPWNCDNCQVVVQGKRCGMCHRWKDGQRDHMLGGGNRTVKREKLDLGTWTCTCGNEVQEPKSRCGKCHHWKGGRRTGGWKLGSKADTTGTAEEDIDRTKDWECCGEVISAAKTRCGKCKKWRGGKRQIRWSYTGNDRVPLMSEEEANVDPAVDWVCKVESCQTINKGVKKRCSACFSWRFSRKKARMSTGMMMMPNDASGTEIKQENNSSGTPPDMSLDQLDALVTHEIQRHGEGGENTVAAAVDGDVTGEQDPMGVTEAQPQQVLQEEQTVTFESV